MTVLERRYARLVRLFYPAGHHRTRGTEITGTYLEFAGPDRRWPSPADVGDLAAGGMREHVRSAGATALEDGLRLAGTLALVTLTALATGFLGLELATPSADASLYVPRFGPFVSLGGIVWVAWLAAVATKLLAPGRWGRLALGAALVVTAAVVPLAEFAGVFRPPLFILLPQAALGVLALVAPSRPRPWVRLLPIAAAAAAAFYVGGLGQHHDGGTFLYYYSSTYEQLPAVAALLLVAALLATVARAARGDHSGGWALLALPAPIALLCLHLLAGTLSNLSSGSSNASWPAMASAALLIVVGAVAVFPLALAAHRRLGRTALEQTHCPTCHAALPSRNRTVPQ